MEKDTVLLSVEDLRVIGVTHIAFNARTGFFEFGSFEKDFAAHDINQDLKEACKTALNRFVSEAKVKANIYIEEFAKSSINIQED
jgi:hypothetical protein